ncbi:MAG: transcriptional regulator, TetR family [Pedosphaera sp.]|nr:transcriptional regulator, TetR family [Pedosphaera sp.]
MGFMDTQQQILAAALRLFASRGYAGTSVQDIVAAARVTKPTLYYYFANKAALYQALVTSAHDERYRLMRAAAKPAATLEQQLVEILTALFDYTRDHRELMRLAFATAFASPDELPDDLDYMNRSRRNFNFMNALIKKGLQTGALDRRFDSQELAFGVYGLMNVYVMAHLMIPECKLDRSTAQRVVQLFLSGAAAKKRSPKRAVADRKPQ